jgi:uncharacterized protein (DUF608 family)
VAYATALSATTLLLLSPDARRRNDGLDPSIVDVSHSAGIPIGGLGSGYSVFGSTGFHDLTFGGASELTAEHRAPLTPAPFALYVHVDGRCHALQTVVPAAPPFDRSETSPVERVLAFAELPKGHFRFEHSSWGLEVAMTAFSPLVPHDLETSSTPVQIFEIAVQNVSGEFKRVEIGLWSEERLLAGGNVARLMRPGGEVAFSVDDGQVNERGASAHVDLQAGEIKVVRFYLGWYFPEFRTPSPAAPDTYRRAYAARFATAADAIRYAKARAELWSRTIDVWRASFDVPPAMKRLWFGSLASVITSTMLAGNRRFFTVEVPHPWVNTMDVSAYANWVYLVNWPELERLDLEQYFEAIPREGERAGFVWHSLWSDAASYSEEPTFILRLWRAHRYFNDKAWLERAFPHALAAAAYLERGGLVDHLVSSPNGNQSYDEWMMPGISAYVNIAWCYAVYALGEMARTLGEPAPIADTDANDLLPIVRDATVELLWSQEHGGYFRCFHRLPNASTASEPESVFTDQLFGRWMALLDARSATVLPEVLVSRALRTCFDNNLVEDQSSGFRGWANGMLPGRRPDAASGYHARTCWLGAQLNLASLLGSAGEEEKSLDVFRSVEKSLGSNHLAVGEWNRAVDAGGEVVVLDAFSKDTPRFPPYPRYASSWEYLLCMLGFSVDDTHIYLRPLKSLRFHIRNVRLAGVRLSVKVEPNWTKARTGSSELARPVALRRDVGAHVVEFVAG